MLNANIPTEGKPLWENAAPYASEEVQSHVTDTNAAAEEMKAAALLERARRICSAYYIEGLMRIIDRTDTGLELLSASDATEAERAQLIQCSLQQQQRILSALAERLRILAAHEQQ
jgi:hypothetical protein